MVLTIYCTYVNIVAMTDLDKSWEALVGPESAAEVTAPAASEELEQEEKQIGERAAHLLKMAREAGFGVASDAIEAKLTEEAQVEAFLAENYKSMLDNLVKAEKILVTKAALKNIEEWLK